GIAILLCALIVFTLSTTGLLKRFDDYLLEARFQLLQKPIDANAVIVAIDTKSLQASPNWPWGRQVHGELVQKLDQAGARAIVFDLDFSAVGDPVGDQRFAEAINAARAPVWLAAHRQPLSPDLPDIVAELLPNEQIRAPAELASVTYPIDPDGLVRRGERFSEFSFGALPTIASALAPRDGERGGYYIDYSISDASIRYYSYTDVLAGDLPESAFSGKNVFIGATALELGDEYVAPAIGLTSGVTLNAIASETLLQGRALNAIGNTTIFALAGLLSILLCAAKARALGRTYVGIHIILIMMILFAPLVAQAYLHLVLPTAALWGVQVACAIYALIRDLEYRSVSAFRAHIQARDTGAVLSTLINENYDGFIVVCPQGVVERCNARAAELLGLEATPKKGDALTIVAHDLARQIDLSQEEVGLIQSLEMSIDDADDEKRRDLDIAVTRSVVEPFKSRFERRTTPRAFIVITLHDITQQKRAEYAERAAREKQEQASRAKSELISNMSHELRTPLNSVIGFSDVIRKEMFGEIGAPEYREYVEMINKSGRGLLSIINDMLSAAKLQANEWVIDRDKEYIEDLVDAALEDARSKPSWSDQSVSVDYGANTPSAIVDAESVRLALAHLIDNAAKFSGEKGEIKIAVSQANGALAIAITDNGPGCDEAMLGRITDLFFQGDGSLNRSHEGAGLGLYLADQIAALNHGQLKLQSPPDGGFTATMTFVDAGTERAVA
ncbi:MAG: CHASE2 domain-containing protein, partial [Pseudomonadota bacterium]